jgi:hypothetical protein
LKFEIEYVKDRTAQEIQKSEKKVQRLESTVTTKILRIKQLERDIESLKVKLEKAEDFSNYYLKRIDFNFMAKNESTTHPSNTYHTPQTSSLHTQTSFPFLPAPQSPKTLLNPTQLSSSSIKIPYQNQPKTSETYLISPKTPTIVAKNTTEKAVQTVRKISLIREENLEREEMDSRLRENSSIFEREETNREMKVQKPIIKLFAKHKTEEEQSEREEIRTDRMTSTDRRQLRKVRR